MASVLHAPRVAPAGRRLGHPAPALADAERERLEAAERAAYERGRRDGAAEGAARAAADQRSLETTLDATVTRLIGAVDAAIVQHADEVASLALEIAATVLGAVPGVSVEALTARILDAVDLLDEPALTVRVHPDHAHLLTPALADRGGRRITVTSDSTIEVGDAVVEGEWGRADLTRRAYLEGVRELLAAEHA